MSSKTLLSSMVAGAMIASMAQADVYEIRFTGEVEWNQITQAPLNAGGAGTSAEVVMLVDSDNFVNSSNYPVRGYVIDPASFKFIINGTPVGMNQFAMLTPQYFVIRDNDPAVDGFYISSVIDFPVGVQLAQSHASLGPFTEVCSVTYGGSMLSSLDIAGAEGTYGYTDIQVFNWVTTAGPFDPQGMLFEQLTITRVSPPCVGDLNGSGAVDGADLGMLLAAWSTSDAAADLDGSGTVDGADLGMLLAAWGPCA